MRTIGILKHDRAGDPEERIAFHAKKRGWHAVQVNPFELMLPMRTGSTIIKAVDSVISRCEIRGAQSRENDQYLRVLEYFEMSNVPVVNNAQSVVNTQDKYRTHLLMTTHGIPTPTSYLVHKKEQVYALLRSGLINFPFLLKDPYGSRGTAVYKVDCKDALDSTFATHFKRISPLVQEFLDFKTDQDGRVGDIRAWVVRDFKTEKPKFVGAYNRFSSNKDNFLTNLSRGGYGKPLGDLIPNLVKYSKKMLDVLGADVLGVDAAPTRRGKLYIIEANIAMDTTEEWRDFVGKDVWKYVVDLAIARANRSK